MFKLIKLAAAVAAGYSVGRLVEAHRQGVPLDTAFRLETILRPIADLAPMPVQPQPLVGANLTVTIPGS